MHFPKCVLHFEVERRELLMTTSNGPLQQVQQSPDLVNVNIVKKGDLVKIFVTPILLLLWSKITVDLVKKLDLVKVLVPPKNFTKSGLYCN